MQLEPGPIPPIGADPFGLTVEDPGFSNLTAYELQELPAIDDAAGQLMFGLLDAAAADPVTFIDAALTGVDAEMAVQSAFDMSAFSGPVDSAFAGVQSRFDTAVLATPSEAWLPVPAPLQVPGGVTPLPTPQTGAVAINNLTRPGATDFISGEGYEIVVQIAGSGTSPTQPAGVTILMGGFLDATQVPERTLGQTDALGVLTYRSVFTRAEVGKWAMSIGIVGGLGNYLPDFTVALAGAPAGATLPMKTRGGATVAIANTSGGSATAFLVGQGVWVAVRGVPNQPVSFAGTHNGAPFGPVALGVTDADGWYILIGTMAAAAVGAWVENYTVGGVAAQAPLILTVS